MNKPTAIQLLVMIAWLSSCGKQQGIEAELKSIGMAQFFQKDNHPLKIVRLGKSADETVELPDGRKDYGIMVKGGYDLIKNHKDRMAATLENVDFPGERISTSHGGSSAFSSKGSTVRLRVRNNMELPMVVVVFENAGGDP